ncbi:MAG TPA: hypothetical protein VF782_07665 [Allosphingosinicella sp.]|jgi:hypothetical protein
MSFRRGLGFVALPLASMSLVGAAGAEEPSPTLAGQFQHICGTSAEAGPALPGEDIAAAQAPSFFAGDLGRATESRVVKMGDRYAMRALVPSSADPKHAVWLKCAVAAGPANFSEEVERLSAMLASKPDMGKTVQDFDYARFTAGLTSFAVHAEPDGWVSIYKMDLMMRNIPRKYLKKGAKPAPPASVR